MQIVAKKMWLLIETMPFVAQDERSTPVRIQIAKDNDGSGNTGRQCVYGKLRAC